MLLDPQTQVGPRPLNMRRASSLDCLPEAGFQGQLALERKRSERSNRPLVLMTIDFAGIRDVSDQNDVAMNALQSITKATRATDVKGWYRNPTMLGVVFTEIALADVLDPLQEKMLLTLRIALGSARVDDLRLRFHSFPEQPIDDAPNDLAPPVFYPDLAQAERSRKVARASKRLVDILGSVACLLLLSPFFLLIPIWLKLTSPGPVIFRQERVGQYGRKFTFLKFRSMHVENDPAAHRRFVHDFIAGKSSDPQSSENGAPVYKLRNDPRITTFGRILRKTSLDELPQFFNVLSGTMSLVGPRPPIPYESEQYDAWHQHRLMAVKPGITGLWQVSGRSSTTFDEMVRLDIQYARDWSLLLDFKILLRTPLAVLAGKGAL